MPSGLADNFGLANTAEAQAGALAKRGNVCSDAVQAQDRDQADQARIDNSFRRYIFINYCTVHSLNTFADLIKKL